MSDPRKPVLTFNAGTEASTSATRIAYKHLKKATEGGARELGVTGASFVILGLGIWATEISELDPIATSKMLMALSIIYDPKAKPQRKEWAERHRKSAVAQIFAAVDLEMSNTEGNA